MSDREADGLNYEFMIYIVKKIKQTVQFDNGLIIRIYNVIFFLYIFWLLYLFFDKTDNDRIYNGGQQRCGGWWGFGADVCIYIIIP